MAIGKVVPLKALSTSPASSIPYSVPNKSHTCFANTFEFLLQYDNRFPNAQFSYYSTRYSQIGDTLRLRDIRENKWHLDVPLNGLANSSVREYQRNRIYKSTFVAIECSNIRVKMDFGDKDKVSVLFHQIRVSASKKIIEDIFPRIIAPLAGVDVDLAHFQPTADQPISISTYTADECFGAIGELPK
ncbi:hypothetical protein HZH68_003741 [Vespula germanica]|uniref:Uncharacterized protein n=1 Tax=Vespula germanica TaxID=30212 RepID=A0A834NPU1_VESGE|nr:hypothetical protein HZH68_003741 [Vespula germanica]